MSNTYVQFSEALKLKSDEEKEWVADHFELFSELSGLDKPDEHPRYEEWNKLRNEVYELDDGAEAPEFQWEISDGEWLSVYAEEAGSPDHAAKFAQLFLKKFHPDDCFTLTWACSCSSPEPGAFGGGAAFVTAENIEWEDSFDWANLKRKGFNAEKDEEE